LFQWLSRKAGFVEDNMKRTELPIFAVTFEDSLPEDLTISPEISSFQTFSNQPRHDF
jgi:hypothetical protein